MNHKLQMTTRWNDDKVNKIPSHFDHKKVKNTKKIRNV